MNVIDELIKIAFFFKKTAFLNKIVGFEVEVYEFILCEKSNDFSLFRDWFKLNWHKATIQRKANNCLNWISESLKDEIKESLHEKYKQDITSKANIPLKFNALAFLRQSVDKGYKLKQNLAAKTSETLAKSLDYLPYSIKLTVSGYKSPLLAILENNTHIKAVFVESVDRLSRNLGLTIDLLDYCSLNKIKIYVGSTVMNRGIGRATLLLLSVFAEFELTGKQTSYSIDLLNVIKFELDRIEFNVLSDSEKKLFNNLQFVEIDQVYEKAIVLSNKYIDNYDYKKLNKKGKRLANNLGLYSNAKEIISLLID